MGDEVPGDNEVDDEARHQADLFPGRGGSGAVDGSSSHWNRTQASQVPQEVHFLISPKCRQICRWRQVAERTKFRMA